MGFVTVNMILYTLIIVLLVGLVYQCKGDNDVPKSSNDLPRHIPRADPTLDYTYGDGPTGPAHWPQLFETCAGNRQSPINIEMAELETLPSNALEWSDGYFKMPRNMSVTNDNRTFVVAADFRKGKTPVISGGPVANTYEFNNIHFHWGTKDDIGSEHTINNAAYPLEMHVVHTLVQDCTVVEDTILVVGYFFRVSEEGTPSLDTILDAGELTTKRLNTPIRIKRDFVLASLVRPFPFEYITYKGSLTTPPCDQTVRWIVNPVPLNISRKQIERFRRIARLSPGLINNFRPTQPLNGRKVYYVPRCECE